jgi:hypothetical protein
MLNFSMESYKGVEGILSVKKDHLINKIVTHLYFENVITIFQGDNVKSDLK